MEAYKSNLCKLFFQSCFDIGLNERAFIKTCADFGDPNLLYKFPGGYKDMVNFIELEQDGCLDKIDFSEIKGVRCKIRKAVYERLMLYSVMPGYREYIRKFISSGLALKAVLPTISNIWYSIGDSSTDFNYYTKRATLYLVYLSSLYFFAYDYSDEHIDTFEFIDSRVNDASKIGVIKNKLKNIFGIS